MKFRVDDAARFRVVGPARAAKVEIAAARPGPGVAAIPLVGQLSSALDNWGSGGW